MKASRVKYLKFWKRKYFVSKQTTHGWYLVETFKWRMSAVMYIRRKMDHGSYLLRNNYNDKETYYWER